jgi:hypothetical protein
LTQIPSNFELDVRVCRRLEQTQSRSPFCGIAYLQVAFYTHLLSERERFSPSKTREMYFFVAKHNSAPSSHFLFELILEIYNVIEEKESLIVFFNIFFVKVN